MTAVRTRTFELTTTVMLHGVDVPQLGEYSQKLGSAIGAVLQDFVPTVTAFLLEPDLASGDVSYGLRFAAIDPAYMEDIANEVLERAVALVADRTGTRPVTIEREGSVLVQA